MNAQNFDWKQLATNALVIGLDPDIEKIGTLNQFEFNKRIIDQTKDIAGSYKPNTAFYEADGARGIENLKKTCDYIRKVAPDTYIIIDAKRGDIGNTNRGYASFVFDYLAADAVTLQPYMGIEALAPFYEYDRTLYILARTSNPGSDEMQLQVVEGEEVYKRVVQSFCGLDVNATIGLVAGATYPEELEVIRNLAGNKTSLLIPGIGVQGGDLEQSLRAGLNDQLGGVQISASRSIIFAEDPRQAALELHQDIEKTIQKITEGANDEQYI
jgi:orotidine-5'-phosphate decarboxylase